MLLNNRQWTLLTFRGLRRRQRFKAPKSGSRTLIDCTTMRSISLLCSGRGIASNRLVGSLRSRSIRWLSSNSEATTIDDPSRLVHGISKEDLESNQALADYVRANFPDAFEPKDQAPSSAIPSGVRTVATSRDIDGTETKEDEKYARNIRPLFTYVRDPVLEEGTRAGKRLRATGMIPGLLYGGDPSLGIYSNQPESKTFVKTPWNILQGELDRYHHHFESRVYDLTLLEHPDDDSGGTVHRVIPRNLQRHPVESSIYCVNFCRYHAGRPIKIPIAYINEEESPALKRDGFILPIQRYIECFVEDHVDIPEALDLECTDLKFKDVIRLDRISLPDGVRLSDRVMKRGDDFILGVVFGKGRGAAAADDGDGGGAEGEEED